MIENGGFATYRFEGMIGFKAGLVHLPRSGLLELLDISICIIGDISRGLVKAWEEATNT